MNGERITFWEFIKEKAIKIPKIQRDYVQGRETVIINDIRSNFLDNLYTALSNHEELDLNFVYGKTVSGNDYVPIDGQQRLTTLFLLHLFAFSKENKTNLIAILKEKLNYETRISTKEFIIKLCENLHRFDFCGDIKKYITDAEWYFSEWDLDPSVKAMIVMLSDIYKRFKEFENLSTALIDSCNVTFMILDIDDLGKENDLYIKMNSRGRPLTSFECFKSELFDYIDKNHLLINEANEFKRRVDNEWLDLLWNDFNYKKESDKVFMELIHYLLFDNYICTNNLNSPEDDDLLVNLDLNEQRSFFSFNNYKRLIDEDSLKMILNVLNALIELKSTYYFNVIKDDIFDSFISESDNKNRHYVNRTCLMGLATYAAGNQFVLEKFEQWYRIVRNLAVSHGYIDDPENFTKAIKTIYSRFDNNISLEYANANLISNAGQIKYFFEKNVDCEVLKAKVIDRDSQWLDEIREVERNKYLHSSIAFLFWLQDINCSNIDTSNPNIHTFKEDYQIFSLMVNEGGPSINDSLFKRGLLTYGNYSFEARSSSTLFFEGGKRYFDFLRLLNEPNSFNIFKSFFVDFKSAYLNSNQSLKVEDFLNDKISSFSNQSDEFIYWLIKEPQLLGYSQQNRYFKSNNAIYYILSKSYLSSEYREFYTYLLFIKLKQQGYEVQYKSGSGQLGTEESRCYIESINNISTHIELIVDNNDIVLCSETIASPLTPPIRISSFDDLCSYVSNEFAITFNI